MYRHYSSVILAAITVLFALGCSGGGGSPVMPDTGITGQATPTSNYQALLGLYEIELDGTNGTANVIPVRGPSFQVNVVKFLQPPSGNPANLGVSINADGTDILNGIFDLDISITHPFPGSNIRGFDVRGIVLGDKGTQLSDFDYEVSYPKPTELRLLNADGYTRWWNAVEFLTPGLFGYTPTVLGSGNPKATVNGYKYFCDGLEADAPMTIDPETRGTFSTENGGGDPNTLARQYVIRFPLVGGFPQVRFRYAICASFASPEPGTTPPAPVEAFGLEANCPEPYQISVVTLPSSTAYYTVSGSGGDLVFQFEIWDWQATENPDGVEDEIGLVRMESPTLWEGLIDPFSNSEPVASSGPTSSAWMVEIEDVTPTASLQDIFITVQSADPTSYAPPMPGAGIYPGGAVLSAFHLITLDLPGNSPPTIGPIFGPDKYVVGTQLTYTLSSMDDLQDGPNLTVEWDFDSDGIFEDDEDGSNTNMTGKYTFLEDTTYFARCRVYDTAMAYSESNVITVEPLSLPFIDPMDSTTEGLWTVENGIFETHTATLEWNVQDDHWSTKDPVLSQYQDYMNTTLISPIIPAGVEDTVTITVTHRYSTESCCDDGMVYYRKNSGSWTSLTSTFADISPGHPDYIDTVMEISDLEPGDYFEIGFAWDTDSSINYYLGWDITHVTVIDNKPPVIDSIIGPSSVDSLGPWQYSVSVTDLDGIGSYMWSVEPDGVTPVYDDPGDSAGSISVTFPADGKFDICIEVTDAGDPPLSSTFGPFDVTVFFEITDAFFSDDFITDTGAWTYTGGSDVSYQDFWHIDTFESWLSNVGPDGCYSESADTTIEKTASRDITFPIDTNDTNLRILHQLDVESGGSSTQPFDGQWVTLDGTVISPSYGFLYDDHDGDWAHGYFHGDSGGLGTSTFELGNGYNDGTAHTLTFHSLSSDTTTNCGPGWQIDLVEIWVID